MKKSGERRSKSGTEEIPELSITGRPDNLKSRSKSQQIYGPNLAQSRDIPTFSALPHRLICFVSHTCILVVGLESDSESLLQREWFAAHLRVPLLFRRTGEGALKYLHA